MGIFKRSNSKRSSSMRNDTKYRSNVNRKLKFEILENRRVMAAAVLNEISVNPIGADQPYEYAEIKGVPNATIENLYFVAIDGDGGAAGVADLVFDLSGKTFGSSGLLMIGGDADGFPIPPGVTYVGTGNLDAGTTQAFENGSQSFALISSPTPILQGTDLDPTKSGTLTLPAGAMVIDAVGWLDGGVTDKVYGALLSAPGAVTTIDAATRFRNDNRPNESGAWYAGDLLGPSNSSLDYEADLSKLTANFPAGGILTPGFVNAPGSNTAPVAVADTYTVVPSGTLDVTPASGLLFNDTDADGVNSILAAVLVSGPTNGTLTLRDDGSFVYVNNGTAGPDIFSYQASDLEAFSSVVTVTINVQASTNTAPTLTLPMGPFVFTEGGGPISFTSGANLTDPDSADFASGSLSITRVGTASPEDQLTLRNEGTGAGQVSFANGVASYQGVDVGNVLGGDNGAPLTINFNPNATLAAVQAILQSIQFENTSQAPGTATRTYSFVVEDGDGGTSNTATTEIAIEAVNSDPTLTLSQTSKTYSVGLGPVALDGLLAIADIDNAVFDGGSLVVSITSNANAGDVLSIRSTGSNAGQVSVTGTSVSVGGTVVGSFTGGTAATSLNVSFNSAATQAAVNAVAQAVTFDTTDTREAPPARLISFTVDDGSNGSATASISLTQSFVRRFAYQQNVDSGAGVYTGAADVELKENSPDTVFGSSNDSTPEGTSGLLIDFDAGANNAQVLLKFADIFGTATSQVPLGAQILAARLVVETDNPGDGGSMHRLLSDFDAEADTWNTFGNGVAGRNTTPGAQADDVEARSQFVSQIGVVEGNSDTRVGKTIIGVTADIQAWADGEANFGWLLKGWDTRTNGWQFLASETASAAARPRLEIDWLPAGVASVSFQQGLNGYAGTIDVDLAQGLPDDVRSEVTPTFVDATDAGATNERQVLLRFDQIVGDQLTGMIPANATIYAATLDIAGNVSNGQGNGGTFHRMLQNWDANATWNSFVNGVNADDVEASSVVTVAAGDPANDLFAEAGFNTYDVTSDVQAWVNGTDNFGWSILPYAGGNNGWGFNSSDATDAALRPKLRVFFTVDGAANTAPQVGSVVFGDGTSQRSKVEKIDVNFDQQVQVDAGAFTLERRVNGAFVAIPASELSIGYTDIGTASASVFRLTFTGSSVQSGSLGDGNYRLSINSSLVRSNGLDLDGDGDGVAGGDFVRGDVATDNFFRLFGDASGNGSVNLQDFNLLRQSIGSSVGQSNFNEAFDFNSNGNINVLDFNAYRQRNGTSRNF